MNQEQIDKAREYNSRQEDNLWYSTELPWPFSSVDPSGDEFVYLTWMHQSHEGLDADGMFGPKTLASVLETFGSVEPVDPGIGSPYGLLVVKRAASQLGVREVGKNSGPHVDAYIKYGHGNVDNDPPWCQYFTYWCYGTAADARDRKTTAPMTGGVIKCWQKSETTGSLRMFPEEILSGARELMPGDQMIRVRNGKPEDVTKVLAGSITYGHTGVVERVDGETVYTIEGNTNLAGSREGDGVYRKSINLNSDILVGFIRHRELH